MFVVCPISEPVCLIYLFYPQLLTHFLTRSAFRFGVDYDSPWIMIHPRLNVDRGYTRSTWTSRFMIGQSTVVTNQQGEGEEYLSITHPFLALHVLQQHRHVDWDALFPPSTPYVIRVINELIIACLLIHIL